MESQVKNSTWPKWLRIVAIGRRPRFTLARVIALVVGTFLVFPFVLLPIRVEGPSMWPTYKEGRINFVNRLAYTWHEPRRGDVVAIRYGYTGRSIMLLKRLVGLPGETIEFKHGRLLIDGRPLDEPYLHLSCSWNIPPRQIPSGRYYFVGDNRSMPEEDHEKGQQDREHIIGKVLL